MGHTGANPSVEELEQFYQSHEQLWSGQPNSTLVDLVSTLGLTPGTALDIGCGEGADAAWLAEQGWQVTAIDPAPTAARRTAQRVPQATVKAQYLSECAGSAGAYDLVCCSYGQLPATDATLRDLAQVVRPGGILVALHHDLDKLTDEHVAMPQWLADNLNGWQCVRAGTAQRSVATGAGAHHHDDVYVVLRRPDSA
ncbi:class I SAM-dependent methyltransferase [Corynebacterium uberis]|uniref:class I SAM-dependent methyltransferase n=1 Tax=Corynebacterium TaxID=1716 RepID=UPI001D0BBDB9|nr:MULTISPECIES: class I SAM-dependent methyltransferase [Corynebacterium]MCZ9309119.1 class I SAM-dependent methyltransferase [Corynebacterium sp. c6VSa_13]UDL74417.1 class I SAM-dependent methyltransferase [Corynebacterium uberis]UDL76748.1 class I SAM-dependent methyltransferase [Corynebacterium uberis]UDL78962.1 class I SAM-dependent methyltransferase [Corynebacterium uberis]UDL81239.1 class I SAM-dependent methyltransferase [Corynebacterium uberis]